MSSPGTVANLRGPRRVLAMLLLFVAIVVFPLSVPATAQVDDAPLSGLFSVTIAANDLPPNVPDAASLVGRWNLTLDEGQAFSLARQDVGEVASGTYSAGPASLDFEQWTGVVACDEADSAGTASYAWRLSGDLLTLTAIDDACDARIVLLTTHPLARLGACQVIAPVSDDPFAIAEASGTPAPGAPAESGVAAQEGVSEATDAERAIDQLLQTAAGCWATADPDSFMALHSQGLTSQIAMMGPAEAFTEELRAFMAAPLALRRIGEVTLEEPGSAWAYVEITLGGAPNPQRLDFVFEDGAWRFDSFFLFGPPLPGPPMGIVP